MLPEGMHWADNGSAATWTTPRFRYSKAHLR